MKNNIKFPYKIRIKNSRHSAEVQKTLFSLGFTWDNGETEVLYQDLNVIEILIEDNCFKFLYNEEKDEPLSDGEREITLKELQSEKFKKELTKNRILYNLK